MRTVMLALLRRRPAFRTLWLAGCTSLVGDWLSLVAVALLVIDRGGGPLALAFTFMAHALPAAIASPVAGAIADRWDRRRVLVGADVVLGVITVAMAAAAALGWVPIVVVLLFVRSGVSAVVPPAEAAALPSIVEKSELMSANTLLAATWSTAYIAGMALGGALALLGPTTAIALDAASFGVAAILHGLLPSLPPVQKNTLGPLAALLRVPADTRDAFRAAMSDRVLARTVFAKTPVALAAGAGWIALNLIGTKESPFGSPAVSFGVLQAIRGAGTGIGPIVARRLQNSNIAVVPLMLLAYGMAFSGVASLGWVRGAVVLSIASFVWGMGSGANWVMSSTQLQTLAPPAVIGRLAAFDELLVTTGMVASAYGGAFVASRHDERTGVLFGIAGPIAAIVLFTLTRASRT
jgi:MFS family permease